MGFTGLIFGAIAAAWLMYLVPYWLRHRSADFIDDDEGDIPFSSAVTIVRSGGPLAPTEPGADISTPMTRRAQLRELTLLEEQAAQRRRRVLIFLLVAQMMVAVLAILRIGAWWGALVPAGLVVAFLVIARFSVRAMRADFARRADAIRSSGDEETVAITLTPEVAAQHEHSIELSVPVAPVGSLWDPVPITRPTYVSQPLAARTVRTIDLSASVSAPRSMPVTADPLTSRPAAEVPHPQEDVG